MLVDAAAVRAYLQLNQTASSSQYTNETIGSNILSAQSMLETATSRWFVPRPATQYVTTSMLRAQVYIPGFRTLTRVAWGGSELTVATPGELGGQGSVWPLLDPLNTGIYVGLQFRAYRADANGMPWWMADSRWFDKALDNPFYPGNYGGGFVFTSMPNDTAIVGDWGWEPGFEPMGAFLAVQFLASFLALRSPSLLSESAVTPQGGIISYAEMPAEARDFIASWSTGAQVISVG